MRGNNQTMSQDLLTLKEAVREYVKGEELFGIDGFAFTPVEAPKISLDKKSGLDALYARYSGCQNCPLGRTRNKIVFGTGVLNPQVLFIGEGPGFEEDRQGLPFVGKAGELLDKILAAINLSRENSVYIANMVKCHPMKNPETPEARGNDRPPEPLEMDACRPILEEQIEILDPPFICALGATAAKALLKTDEGITRLRGRLFDFVLPKSGKKIPLLPTYHPAALLRNPELKREVWQDMKLLRELISSKR